MITKINTDRSDTDRRTALHSREMAYEHHSKEKIKPVQRLKVEFRTIFFALPLMFFAGVYVGIAIMLALQN